jgi:DUF2934 family protein
MPHEPERRRNAASDDGLRRFREELKRQWDAQHNGRQEQAEHPDFSTADIALRAYELFEQRGGGHGQDWDDWFRAERELRQNHARLVLVATR